MTKKIKFFSADNLMLGLKVLLASIATGVTLFIPVWLVMWLIRAQEMLVLGLVIAVGLFFLYYNTLGFWLKKLFKIKH